MTTFAQCAAPLTARGIAVFPCGTDKRPLTRHGFKAATADSAQIDVWSAAHPDALVAQPTGRGSFVLDVDVDTGKGVDGFVTLRANGWDVPATRTHTTRRGGAHYWFRVPEGMTVGCSAGKIGTGLDIRGTGGYVIRWDAHGGEVENANDVLDAPVWLLDAIRATGKKDDHSAKAAQSLSQVAGSEIAEGGRNATLASLAGSMRRRGMTPEAIEAALLAENAEKCVPPLDDDEVRTIARSIGRYEPTPSNPADEQTIMRLAALAPIDYDRVRVEEAERLGIRVSTLDSLVAQARGEEEESAGAALFPGVDSWPQPVDGTALLAEIADTIRRFIVCDEETVIATALWCAAAWLVDVVNVCPILLINAPEKACGKTQLLTVVGKLVPRALQSAGISPAAVYRVIEKYRPTLLVDEIETVLRDNEELRGLFNAGHSRDSALVVRCVGDDFEPTAFRVFGFKAVAGINADRLAETVTSRAVVVQLRRKLPGENADRLRAVDPGLFADLRAKLARWASDHTETIRTARPVLPDALGDRDQDNWEPLLAVADAVGDQWGDKARAAVLTLCGQAGDARRSAGAELLADIRAAFDVRKITRIAMADLLTTLTYDQESPWATWRHGQPMNARDLGKLLGRYGIKSKAVKICGESPKGYDLDQFTDAFARYLDIPSLNGA